MELEHLVYCMDADGDSVPLILGDNEYDGLMTLLSVLKQCRHSAAEIYTSDTHNGESVAFYMETRAEGRMN